MVQGRSRHEALAIMFATVSIHNEFAMMPNVWVDLYSEG